MEQSHWSRSSRYPALIGWTFYYASASTIWISDLISDLECSTLTGQGFVSEILLKFDQQRGLSIEDDQPFGLLFTSASGVLSRKFWYGFLFLIFMFCWSQPINWHQHPHREWAARCALFCRYSREKYFTELKTKINPHTVWTGGQRCSGSAVGRFQNIIYMQGLKKNYLHLYWFLDFWEQQQPTPPCGMFHSFFTSYFPYNKLIFCAAILSLFSRIQNCSGEMQSACPIIQIIITIIIAIMNVFLLSVIFSRSQIINLYK